ncbi:TauD/TfdA dioxygenase family protein [Terricaulis silvestris]|uniref:TauD/TfdA dioxygenase family protein n=1 Tax=Terricaulis silvestris TaxID=2686094 RepID=UPI001E62015E|nr:TauD/TfdA family dioxygenase [Terricaulis silvestris]
MIGIEDLEGGLGVRVSGVDLAKGCDGPTMERLRELLYRHHVLVIGGQSLDTQTYLAFGKRWGAPIEFLREDQRVDGSPEVIIVSNSPFLFPEGARDYAVHWHSDSTYEEVPASTTMLYCLEAPKAGGETLFADTEAAYAALSGEMKARIEGLMGRHKAGAGQRDPEFGERPHSKKPFSEEAQKRIRTFLHPLALTHPVTRKRVLFGVAGTATGIEGMEDATAMKLITDLKRHVLQPQFRGGYTAREGDILLWDNYSLIHTATPIDYSLEDGHRRVLHRISVKGFAPAA